MHQLLHFQPPASIYLLFLWTVAFSFLTASCLKSIFAEVRCTEALPHKDAVWDAVWDSRQFTFPRFQSANPASACSSAQSWWEVPLCGVTSVIFLEQNNTYILENQKKNNLLGRLQVKIAFQWIDLRRKALALHSITLKHASNMT